MAEVSVLTDSDIINTYILVLLLYDIFRAFETGIQDSLEKCFIT